MNGLPSASLDDTMAIAAAALDGSAFGGIQMERPPLCELPYAVLVEALLRVPGFKLDFGSRAPDAALSLVVDRVLGQGILVRERTLFAEDITALAMFTRDLAGGRAVPRISLRSYFAPGDLVWHVDRVEGTRALRLLWPIGRPGGMWLTPADNVDHGRYHGFMRHEYALLGQLDTRVMRTGDAAEAIWAHRPEQVRGLADGSFPFLRDPARIARVAPSAASVHRVETPTSPGAWHRSSWDNRRTPGLQLVITAAS